MKMHWWRYLGAGMLAVPFVALLMAAVPEIIAHARATPLGTWLTAGAMVGVFSIYIFVALWLLERR